MLHRMTWVAAPIVALVVVGAGLGWWGYNQNTERQGLARDAENHYAASFHSLVSNMNNLHQELGKAILLRDSQAFDAETSTLSRLSYASQTEIGQLPITLMPMHNAQTFLAGVSHSTQTWLENGLTPTNQQVHQRLQSYYKESGQLSTKFRKLDDEIMTKGSNAWLATSQALVSNAPNDNQIVDGFRQADVSAAAFVESKEMPISLSRKPQNHFQGQTTISADQAKHKLASFLNTSGSVNWTVSKTMKGATIPEYTITGKTSDGEMHATISQQGGHVLTYRIITVPNKSDYDFVTAQKNASNWLKMRGFNDISEEGSFQSHHVGTFLFAPLKDKVPVLSQVITVQVGLQQGRVVGFDAAEYYSYPLGKVPRRKYNVSQLQNELSEDFMVREVKQVIALDMHNDYQPAVQFYGTANRETYRITMNANTGHVMSVEQLTNEEELD